MKISRNPSDVAPDRPSIVLQLLAGLTPLASQYGGRGVAKALFACCSGDPLSKDEAKLGSLHSAPVPSCIVLRLRLSRCSFCLQGGKKGEGCVFKGSRISMHLQFRAGPSLGVQIRSSYSVIVETCANPPSNLKPNLNLPQFH